MIGRVMREHRRLCITVLITLVLFIVSCLVWTGWGSNAWARPRQRAALDNYRANCADHTISEAADGEVIGVLSIDSLGLETPIRKGVGRSSLRGAVGWYPTSAEPGQVGNFAVAGYRLGYGRPFAGILGLSAGDEITVELCQSTYTYVVDVAPRDLTVDSDDSWVLDPVPGHPEQRPGEAVMTMTANQDLLPTGDRSVGFAHRKA